MNAAVPLTDRPVIVARALGKRFRHRGSGRVVEALGHIDMDVPKGTLTALIGPDGAGKTTFLRLVAGLLRPTSGHLHVLGHDVTKDPQAVQSRISYMPQRFGLYEDLSVDENINLYVALHGLSREAIAQRVDRLLNITDLQRFGSRAAGKLSGGMKQKLGLICTLVRSPDLLLLDEPTVGVDPLSRRELWQIILELVQQDHLTVLLATSSGDEAQRCAQVAVLHQGIVLAQGAPDALVEKARGLCFECLPPAGRSARDGQAYLLAQTDWVLDAVPQGGRVRLIVRPECLDTMGRPQPGMNAGLMAVTPRLEDRLMILLHEAHPDAHSGDTARLAGAPPEEDLSLPEKIGGQNRTKPPAEAVIEVRDLYRAFGDFIAVDHTSFSVIRGEIFGLLGPNGAGKTTTFRLLCGLLPATSGRAYVAGVDLRHARAQARRRIGYVAQKFSLYGHLSVKDNLHFFARAYGLSGRFLSTRTAAVIEQFDLMASLNETAGHLPAGIQQRLAMAVGLLHEPDILFLDEPTSGADALARRAFWRRITALAAQGATIVITTHFMEEAEYCDRVVIQERGRIVAQGSPDSIRKQAAQDAQPVHSMEEAFIAIIERYRKTGHRDYA
jgi:ABC-2 type transport system ATP-binding protein